MECLIVAGMLGHSLAILMTRYAPCGRNIPGTQDEPLGFASLASAARVMDDIISRSIQSSSIFSQRVLSKTVMNDLDQVNNQKRHRLSDVLTPEQETHLVQILAYLWHINGVPWRLRSCGVESDFSVPRFQ